MADQPVAPAPLKPHVVVLGGGIAGIATSMYLLDAGHPVTLIEARRFLGGRVFSFTDRETGAAVDNGQHIFLGCCAYYIQFLKRLGVFEQCYLQPRLRAPIFDRSGRKGLLAASRLPAPFHLLPAFLTYPYLGWRERARALFALTRARFTDRHQARLERMSFYQWLKERGQTDRIIENLWNLLIMPTLNDHVRDVSATMGLMIFQEGMLQGRHNANVGYALDHLSSVTGDPALEYLKSRGARVMLGRPVQRIRIAGGEAQGAQLASRETVTGQRYVSALPPGELLRLLPPEIGALPYFQRIKEIETSPIVNIHLWYDRPVMDGHFCAFLDSPVQWVFNRTDIQADIQAGIRTGIMEDGPSAGSGDEGQRVCISLSAAWEYIDQTREELARRFVKEMGEAFPRAKQARVQRVVVVKQRHATFRCIPGVNDARPGSETPVPNLWLAGEWTNTGWPSTMESAVRSGYNAAQGIMRRIDRPAGPT